MTMGKFVRWLVKIAPNFFGAALRGETREIAIAVAIIACVLLALLLRWLWVAPVEELPVQLPEGTPAHDDWQPPTREEIDKIINMKRQ